MVGGEYWLARQLANFQLAGGSKVILVLGDHAPEYFSKMPALLAPNYSAALTLTYAINPDPSRGPFSSLQCGLKTALADNINLSGIFVLPVDVPVATPKTWHALKNCQTEKRCVIPFDKSTGRGGHPVLLSRSFAELLLRVPVDSPEARLDTQLRGLDPDQQIRLEVDDPCILQNWNTPEDLDR